MVNGLMIGTDWKQVDTLYICAGISSLRPLLDVAGSPDGCINTSVAGIQHTQAVAQKAMDGNILGPLSAALSFVRTSP